jgi:hypothetical protein
VITAVERDENPVRDYNISRAIGLTTMKLVGYTETVHALLDRLGDDSSVVLYGGRKYSASRDAASTRKAAGPGSPTALTRH